MDSTRAAEPSPFFYTSGGASAPQPIEAAEGDFLPPHYPEEKKRYFLGGRKLLALLMVFVLVIFAVGAAVNNVATPTQVPGSGPPVNSASTPVSGAKLYQAYTTNQSQADSSYTNRTVYIQDSLDYGVVMDAGSGLSYSSVNSGSVVLIWSDQSQPGALSSGSLVLAECLVDGLHLSQGAGYLVYLENCSLVSVQAPTTTTTSVPTVNL